MIGRLLPRPILSRGTAADPAENGEGITDLRRALRELKHANRARHRAEEDGKAAQKRLYEVVESLSEGFLLCDCEDRVVLFNSKYLDFFPQLKGLLRPGITFVELAIATAERGAIRLNDPKERGRWIAERLDAHRQADGIRIEALADGRWLQINEKPTEDGVVGLYTDVTEIKESEAKLRAHELTVQSQQLQSTLDNLVQGVSLFDKEGRLAYVNAQMRQIVDLPEEMIEVGTSFEDIRRYENKRGTILDELTARQTTQWLKQSGNVKPIRFEYRRHDGHVIEVQRARMPDGGFVSTYTDVTEQTEAAQALAEAKRHLEARVAERTAELTRATAEAEAANLSKTKFLAAASHDLLQPLNAARLFVSAVDGGGLSEETQRLVERIDTSLGSVEELLKTLIDISRLDAGVVTADFADVGIQTLLSSLASDFAPSAAAKGLRLVVRPCSAVVRCDVVLLRRILQNLLSNAIRYTSHGGVLLGCRRRREGLRIEVWDSGAGIPEDQREEIFREFHRHAHPNQAEQSGLGLGLAIVERAARAQGLQIDLRSTPDRGSVFFLTVPYGETASDDGKPASAHAAEQGLADAFVVVIENDEAIRDGMQNLLERWSCQVLAASGTEDALAQLADAELCPDLIVADYHLEHGALGLESIEALRGHFEQEIPALIITADHSLEVAAQVRDGGYELLHKPIKPAELRSLMAHLLS